MSRQLIEDCVRTSLEKFLKDLDGESVTNVYDMVLKTVERPVLEVVMRHVGANQSQAAAILGINRNTLRKKLGEHGLL
jgi:Fis family transcriptional regulator, factor for inversion stimulation protein